MALLLSLEKNIANKEDFKKPAIQILDEAEDEEELEKLDKE